MNLLRHAVETLERLQIKYHVVGSFASTAFGEARFTQDIDIVASIEDRHVAGLVRAFPEPEFYLNESSIRDAIRWVSQFNLIHPESGNKIDFIIPQSNQWMTVQLSRTRPVRILPDRDVMAAAPEDVIIGKLWYHSEGGGDRHLRDIAGMLRVLGSSLDRLEVERWATEFGYLDVWKEIYNTVDNPEQPPPPSSGPGRRS